MVKYFELNDNEDMIYRNLHDMAKPVPRGQCIAINSYIREIKAE